MPATAGRIPAQRSRRTGLTEKALTLDMAQRLRSELSGGFRVVMTRDSDKFVDLDDRVRLANRYPNGILVSIHFNDSAPRFAGPGNLLVARGQLHAGQARAEPSVRRRQPAQLARPGPPPAAAHPQPMIPCILVECGYISNSREGKSISDPGYRSKLARAIAAGIREQAAFGDGNLGPLPPFIKAPPSRHGDSRGS